MCRQSVGPVFVVDSSSAFNICFHCSGKIFLMPLGRNDALMFRPLMAHLSPQQPSFFFLLVLFLPLPSSLLLLFCFLSDKRICSLCPGDNPVLALRGDLWLVRVNQRLRFLLQVISLGILRYNSGQ